MKDEDFVRMLGLPEGSSLEFKSSLEFVDRIGKTVCAFANTIGGYLVIGVERKRDETTILHGLHNIDTAFQKLAGIMSQLHPKPHYVPFEQIHDGKSFLIINVNPVPSSEICFWNKTAFRRMGSTNEEISGQNLVLFLQNRGTISFEESRSAAKLEDISESKLRSLLEKRVDDLAKHEPLSTKSLLGSLGVANLIGDFYLKNASVIFFANDVRKFFLNPEVRIVKYKGKVKSLEFREYDHRFIDTLPELLESIFSTIREKIGKFSRVVDGKRMESPMIPDDVLREVLTNAVGHRDYFSQDGILVEIYDDRIEITNPGGLLPGQTTKNFIEVKKHRNPIIYRLLNDSKWGEGLNFGIRMIYKIMRTNNLPDPKFDDFSGIFRVILFGPISKRRRKGVEEISERQKIALDYLQKNESVIAPKYAKMAGISHPTAIKYLNELVVLGLLRRLGHYRSSRYIIEKN